MHQTSPVALNPSDAANDCALLVLSCDAYSDLWTPFFTLLQRHWRDCPFPIYLGAEAATYPSTSVKMLRSTAGRNWSQCARDYLSQLSQRYVLIMLDDFFLRRTVKTSLVKECLSFVRDHEVTQLRLVPRPRPTQSLPGNDLIGVSEAGSSYRLSMQAAFWDRAKLCALLHSGESIWEFEHNGNSRSTATPDGFYSVWKPVLPYEGRLTHHVVEKGKWLPHEKLIFARQSVGCDFSRRGSVSTGYLIFYHAARTLDRVLDIFPWRIKAQIKYVLKQSLGIAMGKQLASLSGSTPPTPSARKNSNRDIRN